MEAPGESWLAHGELVMNAHGEQKTRKAHGEPWTGQAHGELTEMPAHGEHVMAHGEPWKDVAHGELMTAAHGEQVHDGRFAQV